MKGKRIYSLDLIKFFAAVLIVFHHYQQERELTFSSGINFFGGKFYFGYLVELFFIISGFVCELRYEENTKSSFSAFMKKKVVRIYPMAVLSILVYTVVSCIYRLIFGEWGGTPVRLWIFFKCVTLTFSGGAATSELGLNNPTWYLCVLLICYAAYGVLLKLFDRLKINPLYGFFTMMLLGLGILDYQINLPFLNYQAARGYLCFFEGVVLVHIYNYCSKRKSGWKTAMLAVTILLVIGGYYWDFATTNNMFSCFLCIRLASYFV